MINTVLGNDKQTIRGIYGPMEQWQVEIGDKVDRIEAYIEDGGTVWFVILHAEKITQRVNSQYVEAVVYY